MAERSLHGQRATAGADGARGGALSAASTPADGADSGACNASVDRDGHADPNI